MTLMSAWSLFQGWTRRLLLRWDAPDFMNFSHPRAIMRG